MTWYDVHSRVVDLTRPITDGLRAHVTTSVVPLQRIGESADRFDPPCEGFSSNLLVMSDHCGTHVDAPSHFIRDGACVDEIEPDTLIGPAVVCDLTSSRGPEITADDLRGVAELARDASIVLLHTRRNDARGKGIDLGAAELLARSGVKAVGTDHSGIDDTRNRGRPGHMVLLGAGVPLVENLTNLDRLLGRRFLFVALPLRLEDGTGSPVRAVAIVTPGENEEIR